MLNYRYSHKMSNKGLWIRRIKLQNIRCFDDIELNFAEEGKSQKFILFLGENGVGKSTILKAIAMTVAGASSLSLLIPDGRHWVRDGKDEGVIRAEIQKSHDDLGLEHVSNVSVILKFYKSQRTVSWESTAHPFPDGGWLAAAYGPFRVPPSLAERKEFYDESSYDPRTVRVINLFQPRSKLISMDSWLKELDYERLRGKQEASLNLFLDAIHKLFLLDFPIRFSEINNEGFATFATPYGKTNLDGLSDGHRTTMIWVSDFLKNLRLAFPGSTTLLHSSGILLLDELDVHLHPRWQREIASLLMKVFPNLQIFTTTHSPLIVQGATEGRVILCKRAENRIILDDDLPSVEGWRADEILEGKDFFGVDVYDKETQGQLNKHRELVAKSKRSPAEQKELENLVEELQSKRVVDAVISGREHEQLSGENENAFEGTSDASQ